MNPIILNSLFWKNSNANIIYMLVYWRCGGQMSSSKLVAAKSLNGLLPVGSHIREKVNLVREKLGFILTIDARKRCLWLATFGQKSARLFDWHFAPASSPKWLVENGGRCCRSAMTVNSSLSVNLLKKNVIKIDRHFLLSETCLRAFILILKRTLHTL